MGFAFPWPMSQGEWLGWSSAAVTVLFGLVFMFGPRLALRVLRLQTVDSHPEAVSEARSTMSGFYLGLGLCCLLLGNQPFLYMALGFSWAFTAFGRIVSMMSDRGNTVYNWLWLVLDILLAAMPLVFVFGFIP
jgi:cytochrome c biogenesis protein CcdA